MNRDVRAMEGSDWVSGLGRAAGGLALGVLVWTATGCGGSGGPPPGEFPVEVAVARPEVAAVEDVLPAVGTVEPDERVVLQPEVPGLIEAIGFEEGQRVERGAVLFRLGSGKEEAQRAQARAEMELARANLERARMLSGTRAISRQELDQMESALAAREATFELESRRLAERTVKAPFDGVLGPRSVSVGQYVQAGAALATLVADDRMKVEFRVPERHLGALEVGKEGRVRVAAFPGRVFAGEVSLIDPEVDAGTRTVGVRLLVPNPEGRLRPGMFARVELVLGRRGDALVVPEGALVPSLDRFSVFRVEESRARLTPVTLGVRLPGKVEVREGIGREATVVVSGTQKLVDGALVAPAEDRAAAVAAVAVR
ncbi:MAG: efflux RND transporter periplasmic adaptor subunit [Verrucomicrobiae bacterium]|nr:efflux RND transporter periplasmic adaptor subunit [Verrucomicrobiae bacterium]